MEFVLADGTEMPHDGCSINISPWSLLLIFMEASCEAELYQAEGYDSSAFVNTDDPVSTLCISRGLTNFSLIAWSVTC